MHKSIALALAVVAALAGAGAAQAHAVLTKPEAVAGSHWAGAVRIGHGCDGSPTTAVRVEIPAGVLNAKPQPKPGWSLEVERAPLPVPVKAEGGREQRDRVSAVTWRGRLPDDQFDEFGLAAKLPTGIERLAFAVIQTCERGEERWIEPSAPGAPRPDHPAPVLTLTPPAQAGHGH